MAEYRFHYEPLRQTMSTSDASSASSSTSSPISQASPSLLSDTVPNVQIIEFDTLQAVRPIAEGGFGVINRAEHELYGEVIYKALKTSKIADNTRTARELIEEARMYTLCQENIVKLLAVVFEPGNYGIVMEFVRFGGLDEFITTHGDKVTRPIKLFLAHGVVRGMKYLHSRQPPVIHSDLKIQNILVGDGFVAKICDFGLSKWKEYSTAHTNSRTNRGTVSHIPPENWKNINHQRTIKFDVYGFAVFMWELFSGEKPFKDAIGTEHISISVMGGQRPDMKAITGPDAMVKFIESCITKCWHQCPADRPTFSELYTTFNKFMSQMQTEVNEQVTAFLAQVREFRKIPALRATMCTDANKIFGIAHLDRVFYVLCEWCSHILVYSADTYERLPDLVLSSRLQHPADIVACELYQRLYIAECDDSSPGCVWQVPVTNGKMRKCLPSSHKATAIKPYTLSVTSGRLLVTSCETRQLLVYNTRDAMRMVWSIELPREIVPRHAVESNRNTILFCHTGPQKRSGLHRVVEVDKEGRVLREFGDKRRRNLDVPRHLAVSADGHVLVADCYNRRILLLDAELRPVRVLVQRNEGVLPWRLCHLETDGRLLIAETWLHACVKVFAI